MGPARSGRNEKNTWGFLKRTPVLYLAGPLYSPCAMVARITYSTLPQVEMEAAKERF